MRAAFSKGVLLIRHQGTCHSELSCRRVATSTRNVFNLVALRSELQRAACLKISFSARPPGFVWISSFLEGVIGEASASRALAGSTCIAAPKSSSVPSLILFCTHSATVISEKGETVRFDAMRCSAGGILRISVDPEVRRATPLEASARSARSRTSSGILSLLIRGHSLGHSPIRAILYAKN
jgi:hypothetical protein